MLRFNSKYLSNYKNIYTVSIIMKKNYVIIDFNDFEIYY